MRAACRELGEVPEDARRQSRVETARPLEAEARRMLSDVLGEDFREEVVADLGAGVRVTTRRGQVDASAAALAREAAQRLTESLTDERAQARPDNDE